jgi:hypothetical protein
VPTPKLTKEQLQEVVDAVARCGSQTAASEAMDIPRPTLEHRLREAKRQGFTANRVAPTGTSTLYGPDGEVKLQWVKSSKEDQTLAQWEQSVKDVFSSVERVATIPLDKRVRSGELLSVYPIGDHHVGMYSWAAETGADYDLKIARKLLVSAVEHLFNVTPDTEEGLIIDVGDFLHVDNIKNETARSGHTLDVDTRYQLMIDAAVDMLRTSIDLGLKKHKRLRVIIEVGNHNDIGAQWLALALSLLYSNNPRVTIDRTPGKYHYFNFGKVLIGTTHGDTGKPEKLSGVMAADQPELWGQTRFRYWLTGHVHNRGVIELPGVIWETFRTLAPRDAWAQASGYRAGRDMTSIVFHKEFGEVARHRFDVAMLKDMGKAA